MISYSPVAMRSKELAYLKAVARRAQQRGRAVFVWQCAAVATWAAVLALALL